MVTQLVVFDGYMEGSMVSTVDARTSVAGKDNAKTSARAIIITEINSGFRFVITLP
jgi:hypothetical protein